MSSFAPPPSVERGRRLLDNWGAWSRMDGPDTGLPRKVNFYTPPRTGDTWAEGDQDKEETKPVINYLEAEWVETLVVVMPPRLKLAVMYSYYHQYEIFLVARRLHVDRDHARRLLTEAEAWIGRQ